MVTSFLPLSFRLIYRDTSSVFIKPFWTYSIWVMSHFTRLEGMSLCFQHLKPRLLIIFTQHMIQVMLLFAHIGLLGIYIGGTHVEITSLEVTVGVGGGVHKEIDPVSLGNEWGGLIADGRDDILIYPWLIYGPVGAFTLTILAMVAVVEGMKEALLGQRSAKKKQKKNLHVGVSPPVDTFDFKKVPGETFH